jgi:hypothetical protein
MSESIKLLTLALELIVTFAGVFLAFMLDRLIDWKKEQKTKEELLKNLACELNRMKDNLTGDAYRLYPDIWESAIASGKLDLLDPEQQTKLTNVYRVIKGTDYEAVRVRDAKEAFEITHSNESRNNLSILSSRHMERMRKTIEAINEVLKEHWLCDYVPKS